MAEAAAAAAEGLLDFESDDEEKEEESDQDIQPRSNISENQSLSEKPSPKKEQMSSLEKYEVKEPEPRKESEPKVNIMVGSSSSHSSESDASLLGSHNGFMKYHDAEKHFPFADDSVVSTPKHHNGGLIIDTPLKLNRKFSFTNYTMDTLNNRFDCTRKSTQFVNNGGHVSPNLKVGYFSLLKPVYFT